jgi:CheY-like chemotaxis protein
VVDDEPAIRNFAKVALERAGLQVLEADDGVHALHMLETIRPDLLLTDIKMPGMDGIELAERVSQTMPDVPIVMMSGFSVHVDRAVKSGMFIQKPFTAKALLEMVTRNLRRC